MIEKLTHQLLSEPKNHEETHPFSPKVFKQWSTRTNIWHPPTDMYETEKSVIVQIEIAGMSEAEFTLSIEENLLAIRGFRSSLQSNGAYHRMEIQSGEFISVVELPVPVDYDRVEASYNDGFLQVLLPKD